MSKLLVCEFDKLKYEALRFWEENDPTFEWDESFLLISDFITVHKISFLSVELQRVKLELSSTLWTVRLEVDRFWSGLTSTTGTLGCTSGELKECWDDVSDAGMWGGLVGKVEGASVVNLGSCGVGEEGLVGNIGLGLGTGTGFVCVGVNCKTPSCFESGTF